MKNWWPNLNEREQKLFAVFGTLLLLICFYSLLWSPITHHYNQLEKTVRSQKELNIWLQQKAAIINQINANNHFINTQTVVAALPDLIKKTLELSDIGQDGITIQPSGNNVSVTMVQVPFDNCIQWLIMLWQQYQIKVLQLQITATPVPGVVSASIVLQSP